MSDPSGGLSLAEWRKEIDGGGLDPFFKESYGEDEVERARDRYRRLGSAIEERFGAQALGATAGAAAGGAEPAGGDKLFYFSTPGRSELGGNHTDHNNGHVLAASVHLDSLALVYATGDSRVELYSEGFPEPFIVDLRERKPVARERGRTEALVRGVASRLAELGYRVGGFRGCITSDVLRGSGLSSSASIEVLIGTIFNHLHNEGKILPVTLAIVGQYAENTFFGKPCGLEDQLACASGGIIGIDFRDPRNPIVEQVPFDFLSYGYVLMVVDSGGSHDDLTEDYAAIPAEMRSVASFFSKSVCREISLEQVLGALPALRGAVGERPILRALHFFADDARVVRQIEALKRRDVEAYLACVRESGSSSWRLLQNCISPHVAGQPLALALGVSEELLRGKGACRVHGGGFAGTIQVYVPRGEADRFTESMSAVFGPRSVTTLRVRNEGTIAVPLPSRL